MEIQGMTVYLSADDVYCANYGSPHIGDPELVEYTNQLVTKFNDFVPPDDIGVTAKEAQVPFLAIPYEPRSYKQLEAAIELGKRLGKQTLGGPA